MKKIFVTYPYGVEGPAVARLEGKVGVVAAMDEDKAIGILVKLHQSALGIVVDISPKK